MDLRRNQCLRSIESNQLYITRYIRDDHDLLREMSEEDFDCRMRYSSSEIWIPVNFIRCLRCYSVMPRGEKDSFSSVEFE